MKRIILLGIISVLFAFNAHAICTGTFINPITDVKWKCMFPISLGGVSAASIPFPEAASAIMSDTLMSGSISPICTCFDPLPHAGLTFAMNNIFRVIEATKDPLCFPTLGMQIGAGPFGTGGSDGGQQDSARPCK